MGSNLELRDPPTRSRLPLCIYEINYGAARVPATARPNTAVPSGGAVLRSHRHAHDVQHGQEGSLVEAAHQEHGEVYSRVPAGGRQTIVAPPHTAVRWHGRARQHGGCQRVEPVPTEQPYSQSTQGRGRGAGRPERAPLCTTGREGGGCPTCRVTPAPPHPLHPPPTRSRRLSPRSLHPFGRAPESGVPAPTAVFFTPADGLWRQIPSPCSSTLPRAPPCVVCSRAGPPTSRAGPRRRFEGASTPRVERDVTGQ